MPLKAGHLGWLMGRMHVPNPNIALGRRGEHPRVPRPYTTAPGAPPFSTRAWLQSAAAWGQWAGGGRKGGRWMARVPGWMRP